MNKYKIYKEVHNEIQARALEVSVRKPSQTMEECWRDGEEQVRYKYEQETRDEIIAQDTNKRYFL
jgi:hypothetical protein